jgi:hypothetical protein
MELRVQARALPGFPYALLFKEALELAQIYTIPRTSYPLVFSGTAPLRDKVIQHRSSLSTISPERVRREKRFRLDRFRYVLERRDARAESSQIFVGAGFGTF